MNVFKSEKGIIQFMLFLILIVLNNNSLSSQVSLPPSDSIKAMLQKADVPAIGIGTIENGQLNQIIVLGDLKEQIQAPYHAIFNVASITKSITTLVTLKLVDQGKWDLDAPLYPFWIDPEVKEDPRHKKLTTRHVLSHQTGFANWRWMHESKKLTFEFEPGSKFGYSGEGFEYLRKALENKFNKRLEQLAKELVFEPFGMSDSRLTWDAQMDSSRYAVPHKTINNAYDLAPKMKANAADDLLTSVEDLGKFGQAILAGADLQEAVFQEMVRPQVEARPGLNFGLGWISLQNLSNQEYALLNAGSDQGVNAAILLLPQSKRGIVILTNGDGGRKLVMQLIAKSLGQIGSEVLSRL